MVEPFLNHTHSVWFSFHNKQNGNSHFVEIEITVFIVQFNCDNLSISYKKRFAATEIGGI